MPSIPFDATNPFLKNRYASLGSVIEHSRPILAKYGLSIIQPPINDGDRIGVESTLLHTSGEFITTRFTLPLGDEKGKSLAQVAGSVVTYLRRYSWASILGLYADEDTDGEEAPKRPQDAPRAARAPTPPQAAQKPATEPPSAKSAPSSEDADRKVLITQLVKLCGPAMLPELIRALRNMQPKSGGPPLLLGKEGLDDLPVQQLRGLVNKWDEIYPKIDQWLNEHPEPTPEPAAPAPTPEPPKGKPETSVWPDGTKTKSGIIVEVSTKSGGDGNKKWTRYGVKIDGEWYSTFSHDFGKQAQEWRGMLVTVAFTEGAKGKDLVDLFLPEITP